MSTLNNVAREVSVDNLVVCVFANRDYVPVLDVWNKFFKKTANCKYLVFALDRETHEFCFQHGLDVFFTPFEGDWLSFMRHQMLLTRKILDLGYTILVSDVDALWIKNPIDFTLSQDSDLVFSPGTIQPPRAHAQWGNVLCTGYFLVRPSDKVDSFLDCVQERMLREGDQPAINHELLERGMKWDSQDSVYKIEFREKSILQTITPRRGAAGGLTVTLLPNRYFQRLTEDEDAYVIHPIAPKKCADKLRVFKDLGVI
jgi:hypothetical protein